MSLEARYIQAPTKMFVGDTMGNTASFKAGETKLVVGSLVLPAMAAGGLAVKDEKGILDENIEDLLAPDSKVLHDASHDACMIIRSEGDPAKHTSAGRPRVSEVEKLCEYIDDSYITAELVNEVWDEITETN